MSSDLHSRPTPGESAPERPSIVTAERLETLTALTERCFLHAGESLSELLGREVRLSASDVSAMQLDALPALAAQSGAPLGGLQFHIEGEGGGCIIVLFPLLAIQRMLEAIAGHPAEGGGFTDVERSAICEIGNVLASSFLTELGDGTGRRLMPSTPRLLLEDLERVMADTRAALAQQGPEVVVIQGLFEDPEHEIEGHFYILPEVDRTWTIRQR